MDTTRLRGIASRATPLWDRRPAGPIPATAVDARRTRNAIERWRTVLGGPRILTNRLRASAIPLPALERMLGGEHCQTGVPSWAVTLDHMLSVTSGSEAGWTGGAGARDRSYSRRAPLPFQEVLVGFVRYAREQVKDRAGPALAILRLPALVALERQLLGHLTFIASLTIGRDYYMYRFDRAPASAFESLWHQRAPSSRIYRAYVRHMSGRGLDELLDSHPVLARLLSQAMEQWIGAVTEFSIRFLQDFPDSRRAFGWTIDRPSGAVARLRADLSDRHGDGRTVLQCRLESGELVVYKPRTVKPEEAFSCFIDWLNDRGLPLQLKSLRVLDRATHGWIENVAFRRCRAASQVPRFYRRAGMLIAALHALGVTDIHRENLIASGEHPVVVDLETILNYGVRAGPGFHSADADEESLGTGPSVMSTGMLPFPPTASDQDECDMSALGSDDTQQPSIRSFVWSKVNTDQMTISEAAVRTSRMTHQVQFRGRRPCALDHVSSILDGFGETYHCLLRNRDRLIADERLMGAFEGLDRRILVRSTVTYTRLQLYCLHPQFLKDGVDRTIELEWLARPLSPRALQEGPRRVYESERVAMERLDVPRFTASEWGALAPAFDDEDMRRLFEPQDSHAVRQRFLGLSEADCQRQAAIIAKALRLRFTA